MTRKKVKLMWIVNDAARKASLKKRRVGLLKKVSELNTLCGIDAFIIIYSPDDSEPALWPSGLEVEQLILRFRNMSEMDQQKNMMNQESYLKERMKKVQEQSKKQIKKTMEIEISYLLQKVHEDKGFDRLDQTQLCGLSWMVEEKLKEIKRRKEYFQPIPPFQPPRSFPSSSVPPHGADDGDKKDETIGGVGRGLGVENPIDGARSWDEWFSDIISNPEHNVAGGSSTMGHLEMSHPFNPVGGRSYEEPNLGFYHDVGEQPNIFRSEHMYNRIDFDMGFLPHADINAGQIDLLRQLPHNNNFQGGNNTRTIFEPRQPFGFNLEGGVSGIGNNLDQWLPQGGNVGGNSDANNPDQWLPLANQYDPWLARGDTASHYDIGYGLFPNSNEPSSNIGGDRFQGLDQHHDGSSGAGASNTGESDARLSGHLRGSNNFGLPFDGTTDWSHHKFEP